MLRNANYYSASTKNITHLSGLLAAIYFNFPLYVQYNQMLIRLMQIKIPQLLLTTLMINYSEIWEEIRSLSYQNVEGFYTLFSHYGQSFAKNLHANCMSNKRPLPEQTTGTPGVLEELDLSFPKPGVFGFNQLKEELIGEFINFAGEVTPLDDQTVLSLSTEWKKLVSREQELISEKNRLNSDWQRLNDPIEKITEENYSILLQYKMVTEDETVDEALKVLEVTFKPVYQYWQQCQR